MRIEARGVGKRFGRVVALDGVGFEIAAGSRVALVGPNGSGKSTLNRILMGLLACDGEVRLDGCSPFDQRVRIAAQMAYVPQAAPQLGARVGEVVGSVARVRGLTREEIARFAHAMELNLDAIASLPFRSLSGGTKQKLLIALAFSARASLLILDEPTGSLDARARERFFELFEAISPGTTLLLCSHRLEEVRPLVDHVLFLEEGRLAWEGRAARFLELCSSSVIEVWADGEEALAWLRARGFRPTPGGAWVCSAPHADKLKRVEELVRELGGRLRNLNVRDLERLDLSGVRGGAGRA